MSNQNIDNIDTVELGLKLKEARNKRGLNQADVAKIIDVSRTTIVAIEKGKRRINELELAKLSNLYGRDVSEFLVDENYYGVADIQFRAPEELTEDEQFTEEDREEFIKLCQYYYELERLMEVEPEYHYPRQYPTQHMSIHQAAEVISRKERIRLQLGDKPIAKFRELLEDQVGLRVFFIPMNSNIAGMYFYTDALGGCIAINSKHPVERQRWSLAHEYAHFLIDRYQTDITIYRKNGYVIKSASEKIADAFAKYFLLPQSGLITRFEELARETDGRLSPAGLCTIANEYGVSVEAMVIRLEGERLIETGKYDQLRERGFSPREAQKKLGLVPVDERKGIVPLRLKRLAVDAFGSGQIDEDQLAYLLGLKTDIHEARSVAMTMLGSSENLFEAL